MKLFIPDFYRDVEVCIYGIDNEEHTEEFIIIHFWDKGLIKLSDEDKEKYGTEADYAINNENFEAFAQVVEPLQKAIDAIAEDARKKREKPKEVFTFDSNYFAV